MNPALMSLINTIAVLAILSPFFDWMLRHYPDIAIIIAFVFAIWKFISWINSKFKNMDENLGKLSEKMEEQFKEVDLHLEKVDGRRDHIGFRLDQHQAAIQNLDHKFDQLQKDVIKIDIRLNIVEVKVDTLTETVKKMDEKFEKRFDRLEEILLKKQDSKY